MNNNLIKNLQIGDQTYTLCSISDNSPSLLRSDNKCFRYDMFNYTIIRPNVISSIRDYDNVCVIGLPQEYIQESGNLVLFCENFGILNRNSSDIEGYQCKLTVLMNYLTDATDSWMYPNTDEYTKYKVSLFWNDENTNTYYMRLCTLDGNLIQETYYEGNLVNDLLSNIHEASNMCVYVDGNSVRIKLYEQIEGNDSWAYIDIYGGYGYEMSAQIPILPGSYYDHFLFIYFGPSYLEVNPVNHYLFNITTAGQLTTNIPINWSQDDIPELGYDKLVQLSVLDGIGSYNSIQLE